jgi:hypothetical protein
MIPDEMAKTLTPINNQRLYALLEEQSNLVAESTAMVDAVRQEIARRQGEDGKIEKLFHAWLTSSDEKSVRHCQNSLLKGWGIKVSRAKK